MNHQFVVVVALQILDEQNLDEVLPYFHLLLAHPEVYFLPDVARRLDLVVLVDEEELKDFQKDYFQVWHRPDLVVLVDEEELKVLQKDYFQLWQQEQLVVLQEVELERYFLAGSLLLPEQ
jgi:protoheme ferro-lyase